MPAVTTKQIRELGREIVLRTPGGIRYGEIVRQVREAYPDAPVTTIAAQIANALVPSFPNEIIKPSRGLYKPLTAGNDGEAPVPVAPDLVTPTGFQREEEVYEPFAEWLQNDLEEATAAVALGGAGLKAKWGTPDVVGVYRPLTADLIKFSPEIVAVEIKLDPTQSIVAFGQAIAYRLFATRSYLVMYGVPLAEVDTPRVDKRGADRVEGCS
ncbi:MAG TPA: hypothetical protein VEB43_16860 [Anaeromyxobacter sp.]|nr:hypothetical protein [Anaeromyxobacter sp.]